MCNTSSQVLLKSSPVTHIPAAGDATFDRKSEMSRGTTKVQSIPGLPLNAKDGIGTLSLSSGSKARRKLSKAIMLHVAIYFVLPITVRPSEEPCSVKCNLGNLNACPSFIQRGDSFKEDPSRRSLLCSRRRGGVEVELSSFKALSGTVVFPSRIRHGARQRQLGGGWRRHFGTLGTTPRYIRPQFYRGISRGNPSLKILS